MRASPAALLFATAIVALVLFATACPGGEPDPEPAKVDATSTGGEELPIDGS